MKRLTTKKFQLLVALEYLKNLALTGIKVTPEIEKQIYKCNSQLLALINE